MTFDHPIHRVEEPNHFNLVCSVDETSIQLLESELGYVKAKLRILEKGRIMKPLSVEER